MDFTDKEKIGLFDKIEELYFRRNFGSVSKADFETLLFSEFIECCINHNEPFDDYSLSKALGITQTRIRSLKERKELKYPLYESDPDWWKKSFAEAVKNAKYDEKDHCVKFIIQDVNVMNEARHYIEESGWYDECSLNRKLLRIPLDCFTDICIDEKDINELFSEKERKTINKIAQENSEVASFAEDFSKEGLKSFLMSATKEAISLVLQSLPFGGIANIAFKSLAEIIMKMD